MRRREFKDRKGPGRSSDPFLRPSVQPRLEVGKPGDKFEQEADNVANKVVNDTGAGAVQKAAAPEEESVQKKPLAGSISSVRKKDLQQAPAREEEPVQKAAEAEEETVQKAADEEEPVQKAEEEEVQKAEEEEPVQKAEEEETVQKAEEEESVQKAEEEETVQKAEEEEEAVQKAEEDEQPVQQKGDGTTGPRTESRLASAKGSGRPMTGALKQQMESGFGADFSGVRIHDDTEAQQMTSDMRAQAFTHGKDIYFNKGKFDPNSREGQHLIAHELTHTIQQEGATQKSVQRHMQKTYPWDGYVSATYSAALRKVAAKSGWIADIPKGTRLTVIGNSGNWLNVRVMVNGMQRTGYMSQELVSLSTTDGVANEMGDMVGDKATWNPSGPGRYGNPNTFVKWAEAKTESAAPPVTSVTVINCWEMILLAAYRSGAISWSFIHNLYLNTKGDWYAELPARLTSGQRMNYDILKKTPKPKRGDLVFFDGAGHVALATGNGDQIYTFWPPPNTKFTYGGTIDAVKVSTISALYTFMKKGGKAPKVTIGKPIW